MSYNITNSVRFPQTAVDASGFLNVSNKTILGNYVQDKDELPLLLDRVSSGAATQTWTNGVVDMQVGAAEYAICQSFKRHLYLGGKSQRVEMTFNEMGVQANVTKRVGYFSSSNVAPYTASLDGFYLEMEGGTHRIVINKGGIPVASIPRASWDDPLDGTGTSGINIDLKDFNVMVFEFLYLGGTELEVSFIVGDKQYIAHTYKNSGINGSTFVNSPVQPVRWEVRGNGSAGELGQVCAAVSTGGALDLVGYPHAVDLGQANFINANAAGTTYLVAALRLNDQKAIGLEIMGDLLASTNDDYIARFIVNPTIAGAALTWNAIPNSGYDWAIGDIANPSTNTVTGGTIISSVFGTGNSIRSLEANSLFQIGSDIAGNSDILALCIEPIGTNLDIRGAINFKTL